MIQNRKYEFPILELYETKKVVYEPNKKFPVSRFLGRSVIVEKEPVDEYERKARKLKLLVLAIALVLLILLIIAIIALGISSTKTILIECKGDRCKTTSAAMTTKIKPNCSFGYILVNETCYGKYTFFQLDQICFSFYVEECGSTFVTPNVRIIGGVKAIENSWPSQVYIVQRYKGTYYLNNEFVEVKITSPCSGTLINAETVVTAAHCLKDNNFNYEYKGKVYNLMFKSGSDYPTFESMWTVYIGVNDMSFLNYSEYANVLYRNVSRIIRVSFFFVSTCVELWVFKHELYDSVNNLNDIALVKLSRPVEFSKYAQPACLPRQKSNKYPTEGSESYVAGWGATSNHGEQSVFLNNVKLTILEEFNCWNTLVNYIKNWNSQICAGETDEKKNTCNGDSGAGLFTKQTVNERVVYVLAGIVSMGERCENFKKFGIYTRTSYYIDWISAYLN